MAEIEYTRDGALARIVINRPERKNALANDMRQELAAAFSAANRDDEVRAVVLSAVGETFCAGADVGKIAVRDVKGSRNNLQNNAHTLIRALYTIEKPVIASVRGPCVGIGLSMALAADMIVASDTARFSCIFTRRGLAPDSGAAFFLSRVIGLARARELVFTGRFFGAEEAAKMDIVTRVVPDAELEASTEDLAAQLAAMPTYALAMAKKMFQLSFSPGLDQFLELEAMIQPQIHQTHDFREGIDAFKEKRDPKFTGR